MQWSFWCGQEVGLPSVRYPTPQLDFRKINYSVSKLLRSPWEKVQVYSLVYA